MRRSEFREKIVMLLYIKALEGDMDKSEYSKELVNRYQEILEKQDDNLV